MCRRGKPAPDVRPAAGADHQLQPALPGRRHRRSGQADQLGNPVQSVLRYIPAVRRTQHITISQILFTTHVQMSLDQWELIIE